MPKRKILFFVPLPPPITGAGLRNQTLVNSEVLHTAFSIRVIPFDFAEGVSDIGRMSLKKAGKFVARFFSLGRAVLTFKPDLVYFNFSVYGFALYRDFLFVVLLKALRARIVFHLRTQGVRQQALASVFKRHMFTWVFRHSTVICLSKFMAQDIVDVFQGNVLTVNNGIEDETLRCPVRPRQADTFARIFYIGHLWKFKGVLDLIQALGDVQRAGLRFEAVIAGPEGDLSFQELKDRLLLTEIAESVFLPGPKTGLDKLQLYRDSDIFILPTHFDAFPGAILEAMQFELPVISTFEGAIPEIVDDGITGILYNKGDIGQLAGSISRLIMHPDQRQKMGAEGRKKYLAKYRSELFETNMRNAFLSVLDKE